MPKSTRNPFGRRGGTVTVIEDRVQRSAIRRAKIAFWVTAVITALLGATIAASYTNPILAVIIGIVAGIITGAVVFVAVAVWPIVRALWWWLPEITLGLALGYAWVLVASQTTLLVRLAIVFGTAVIAVLALAMFPAIRHYVGGLVWCLITRHRIRVCFAQFIISNRHDSYPFILWARPTPVGERVWIWLRPGLALADIESRLDKIAAACWASNVTVETASKSNTAYIRMDVKRGNALTGVIPSPLVGLIDHTATGTTAVNKPMDTIPTALDLPDVTADAVRESDTKRPETKTDKPAKKATASTASAGSDIEDWI